ncbi:hypothetical protein MG293_000461, partial [Ovis ammon polii]
VCLLNLLNEFICMTETKYPIICYIIAAQIKATLKFQPHPPCEDVLPQIDYKLAKNRTLLLLLLTLQSCLTVCDPMDGSPPGSPVPGILQAGTLEWVAISFSNA